MWEEHCYDSVLAGKAVSAEDHRLAVNTADVMARPLGLGSPSAHDGREGPVRPAHGGHGGALREARTLP